jgi:DNA-binding Lrp family transcriptional regulator
MLSHKELLILTHLRHNARESLTRLSKKTGIPISTIHDKLKARYAGVIQKYAAIVDFGKLGFGNRAYIILRVNKSQRAAVLDFLLRQEFVNSLFKINNGYDFLVEGLFRGIRELEIFTERLDERFDIKEVKVYHIIDDIRREEFLNTPESLRLLEPDEGTPPRHGGEAGIADDVEKRGDGEEEEEEEAEDEWKPRRDKQRKVGPRDSRRV